MIDTLIADIGALPILASSYPSSSDGPSLSTVVLGAASKLPLAYLESAASEPNSELFLPKLATATKLAHHYFENVYPRLPFFSIQGFWAQFHHVFSSDTVTLSSTQKPTPPQDPTSILSPSRIDLATSELNQGYSYFTVLIVLAISTSSLSRSADSIISNQAQRLFHTALKFQESAILPNTIVGVQSLLFLIQYATFNPSVLDAWYLIGVGMRNCVDLGLHQDPQSFESTSPSLLETRRRLWWSMYSFDRSVSLGCRRPTEISDSVIGAQLPTFKIESIASEVDIQGYLQRYRMLQIQSRIYDLLNSRPESLSRDPSSIVADLAAKLAAWKEGNSPEHSQTLVWSEFFMGKMLLYRPCCLIPERTGEEIKELWTAQLGFVSLYRQLVESNSIFYVQIASEKAYWTGLGSLYCFWKLFLTNRTLDPIIRPVELWMAVKDVLFVLRTLSERWDDGKILAHEFEATSSRVIQLVETVPDYNELKTKLPPEVVSFGDHVSLTSIWTSQSTETRWGAQNSGENGELHELISEMMNT